ncbi:hypothetical protein ACN38_g5404 [Penicillium nordicum]|uniref:Uncharacterized protein n=1 Tax=Penicillium nordicum TaxID=229535 RepID=A0A0M8P2B4_9EURO|nr:hypothetical protein ACN38_g5404 [Penicillium nordicum]
MRTGLFKGRGVASYVVVVNCLIRFDSRQSTNTGCQRYGHIEYWPCKICGLSTAERTALFSTPYGPYVQD